MSARLTVTLQSQVQVEKRTKGLHSWSMRKGLCAEHKAGRQAKTVDLIDVQPMDAPVCCKQALQDPNNNTESHAPTCAGSKYIMNAATGTSSFIQC